MKVFLFIISKNKEVMPPSPETLASSLAILARCLATSLTYAISRAYTRCCNCNRLRMLNDVMGAGGGAGTGNGVSTGVSTCRSYGTSWVDGPGEAEVQLEQRGAGHPWWWWLEGGQTPCWEGWEEGRGGWEE